MLYSLFHFRNNICDQYFVWHIYRIKGTSLLPSPGKENECQRFCMPHLVSRICIRVAMEAKKNKGLVIEGYPIEGLSIAGHETCIILPTLNLAFDIGKCPQRAISQQFLFISHGHMDHIVNLFVSGWLSLFSILDF